MDVVNRYEKSIDIFRHLDLIAINLLRFSDVAKLDSNNQLKSSIIITTDYFKSRKPVESYFKETLFSNFYIDFNEHYMPLSYEDDEHLVVANFNDTISDVGSYLKARKYDLVSPYLTDREKRDMYVELRKLIRKFSVSRSAAFNCTVYSYLYKLLVVLLDGVEPRMERMSGRAFISGLFVMAAYIVYSIYVIKNGGCIADYFLALSVYTLAIILLVKSCRYAIANRFDWLTIYRYDIAIYMIGFVNIFNMGILFKEFIFGEAGSNTACLGWIAQLININELLLEYILLYVIVCYIIMINMLPFLVRRDKKVLDEWRGAGR